MGPSFYSILPVFLFTLVEGIMGVIFVTAHFDHIAVAVITSIVNCVGFVTVLCL